MGGLLIELDQMQGSQTISNNPASASSGPIAYSKIEKQPRPEETSEGSVLVQGGVKRRMVGISFLSEFRLSIWRSQTSNSRKECLRMRNVMRVSSFSSTSGPEKGHKHKEFRQKPPSQTPNLEGPLTPEIFMLGASFPLKLQEKGQTQRISGGGG